MVNTEIRCDSLGIYILCKFQNFQRGDSTICLNEMLTTGQTLHGQRKGHKSAVTVANMQMKMQRSYQTRVVGDYSMGVHYTGKIDNNFKLCCVL